MKVNNETYRKESEQKLTEQTEYDNQELSYEFKRASIFKLTDTLNADFNGDGKLDQAVFKKENETSEIVITHGETNQKIEIGFGKPFAHLTEFNWVDYWGIVNDAETYEIVIEDAEMITFKEGKCVWIHQTG